MTGGFTEVGVDVGASKERLQMALNALNENDWKGADAALNEVENGVVMESMESDLPLLRARENLAVAQAAARRDRWTETRTALRAAGRALNEYAQTRPARASEAKYLTQQIDQSRRQRRGQS